jgi:hypothetical protein
MYTYIYTHIRYKVDKVDKMDSMDKMDKLDNIGIMSLILS